MGNYESNTRHSSQDFKREYFKKIEQDMNKTMKLVNSIIYQDNKLNLDEENWNIYLKINLKDFTEKSNIKSGNTDYINEIIKYIESLNNYEYFNLKHKFKIFLANVIDELKNTNKDNERIN